MPEAEAEPETPSGSSSGGVEARNRGQFQPGVSGNPGGKPKAGGEASPKPSRLLLDMRLVYEQDESKDKTPGQKALRELFKKNPQGFITQLGRLEQAHSAGAGKARSVEQAAEPEQLVKLDGGTERLLTLLRRLRVEAEAKAMREGK